MGDDCGYAGTSMMGPINFYIDYTYNSPGTYVVNIINSPGYGGCIIAKTTVNVVDCNTGNSTAACQGSFRPSAGDYVVSFWVKDDVPLGAITYSSGVEVVLTGMATGPSTIQVFANDVSNAQNTIIDGWQKVEKVITIPSDATGIEVALKSRLASGDTYFDDIRIHPFNSSFKSYVYDPVTLRLAAELDERNYATFYEYDEEGQLIRVKKETERGIKTIKESRASVSK
jgi:hypothetical protein